MCHVNLADGFRGGERQTELLVAELGDQGVRQIVVLRRGGGLHRRLRCGSLTTIRPVNSNNPAAVVLAARDARLLHAHEGRAVHIAHVRRLLFRTPYVITRRVSHPPGSGWLTRRAYLAAAAVVGVSRTVCSILAAYDSRIEAHVITDAASRLPAEPASVRALAARFSGKFVVGHVGALDQATKGQAFLIRAARSLAGDHPDIHFILVGAGPDEARFRAEAEGLRNVSFIGFADNVGDWLSVFDVFAFPSLQEGLGSTLLDALQFGLPVVASEAGGIPDVISHGENGLLVPPGNPDALRDAILALYADHSRRSAMGAAARAVAGGYTVERMAAAYLEVYRGILRLGRQA